MQTARELFVHELTDLLDAEQQLITALEEQAEESSRPELQKAFESHRQQTERQVERIQQVFQELGEEAEESECAGIRGIIEEHKNFKEEDPSEDVLDVFNVGAASKVESYEIAAYESLVGAARDLKLRKAVQLLSQNLKEEQQTLRKMQAFSKKVKPEQSGIEEIDEQPKRRARRVA